MPADWAVRSLVVKTLSACSPPFQNQVADSRDLPVATVWRYHGGGVEECKQQWQMNDWNVARWRVASLLPKFIKNPNGVPDYSGKIPVRFVSEGLGHDLGPVTNQSELLEEVES